ncbi:MAG: carboxylesterase/lipase family protein [Alloacidobacterium sp.]|jgi:para-nitrobenzyl esterase
MDKNQDLSSVGASGQGIVVERRDVIKGIALIAGGAFATTVSSAPMHAEAAEAENSTHLNSNPSVVAQDNNPIVATSAGRVVGYLRNGICTFQGIPYGDTTEGASRFMPPAKPKPWNGVRSSRQHGPVAPQAARAGWANDEEAFMFSWDDGIQGEDCLRVNVWTPAVNDNKKRPVMVWLHGGGYAAGSGQELLSYDGENLARRGDVVVVTLNHRLNVLGYLNLAKYGDKYASSANVGMLDIVAALEWVRDNIAAFGGDPGVVTIFGQSGGGGKVSTLMGMPAAKGLFHRAIVESGSMLRANTEERSQKLTDLLIAELGLTASTIDQLQTLPYAQLSRASQEVMRKNNPRPAGGVPNFRRMAEMLGFSPVVDGTILPAHPFDPQASAISADVPMIMGSTLNEFVTAINHPEYESMTAADVEQRVRGMFGDKTPAILAAFRQRTPDAKPFDLWSHIAASTVRENAIKQCKAKTALGKAPAYLYWFTWQTPILDGRPRAFHCSEIAFAFDNTDRCQNMTGGGADARALAAKVSEAWIHFARTGNPNHAEIPHWPEFAPGTVPTMIFDKKCEAINNPDGGEQASIAEA